MTEVERDHFARLMVDSIVQAGEPKPIRYDPEAFCIKTEDGSFYLNNPFHEYCNAEEEDRDRLIHHYTRAWFSRLKEIPDEFEDVKPDLLPGVRSRCYYEITTLQMRLQDVVDLEWPYQVLGDHLGVGVVYDQREAIMPLQQRHFADWGVSFEETLAFACKNLLDVSTEGLDELLPGVYQSPWQDNHDASRLALTDWIRAHPVQGRHVAMVPNRDTLLLTGSEDSEGILRMSALAELAFDHPRPILGIPLLLDGDRWVPYLPAENHPAYLRLKRMFVQSIGQGYAEQTELLNALMEKLGEDWFVANYTAVESEESRHVGSYCVWIEGLPSLLPRTEEVCFVKPRGEDDAEIIAKARWDDVCSVMGDLMQPTKFYPERYQVVQFPSEEQLAQLPSDDFLE